MPWHRGKIFLVTPGQTPSWLNTSHPRIQVVDQVGLTSTTDLELDFCPNQDLRLGCSRVVSGTCLLDDCRLRLAGLIG